MVQSQTTPLENTAWCERDTLMSIDQWSATRCVGWNAGTTPHEHWLRGTSQVESLTKVLAAEAKINEEMKRCNPLEWAAAMQGLQAQAEEIVCAELIYAEENTNDSLSLPGKW